MTEFLQYLFGRLKQEKPVTVKVGDEHYAVRMDGTLGDPVRALAPQWDKPTLRVGTLSALAAAVRAKIDGFPDDVALHVANEITVQLVSTKADEYGRRHLYISAVHAQETPFTFNSYMTAEAFQIGFRTSFFLTDDAMKVLTVVSNLEAGQTISTADDGLSQSIEIKAGTSSKTAVVLPKEGIPLVPWRTFRDANPVESKFLLRLKQVKDAPPMVALFEIDQKWKLDTIQSIAAWLDKQQLGIAIIA